MEHPELIETAFAEYLKNLDPVPWSGALGNGDSLRIFPGENNQDKDGPYIRCVTEMAEEDPPCSGNRWAEVTVELVTPVVEKTAETDPDPLESHKANASALQTAILATDLPDQLTAAVDGFNCFGLSERTPIREQDEFAWRSGYHVRIYSCPSALTP